MKSFIVNFPFIEKRLTANQTKGANKFSVGSIAKSLKEDCAKVILKEKKKQGIKEVYYGGIINIYWFFTNNGIKDYDNFHAGTKYYIDSFVDKKVIEKDDGHHLIPGDSLFIFKQKKEYLRFVIDLFKTKEQFTEYYNDRLQNARIQ